MNRVFKFMFVLELIVCFAPAVFLLILGVVIMPVSFIMEPRVSNLDGLAMVLGGLCGLVGISAALAALMSGARSRLPTPVILVLAALGFASLLPLVVGSVDSFGWRIVGLLPILAGLHVVYLARAQLLRRAPTTRHASDDV
jgi:hypothetical protein